MKTILDVFTGMNWQEMTFTICLFIIGLFVGYVSHIIKRWNEERRFKSVEKKGAKWINAHSIDDIANACEKGEVDIDLAMRVLINKIANEIQTVEFTDADDDKQVDELDEANEANIDLSTALMTIGELKKGEKV